MFSRAYVQDRSLANSESASPSSSITEQAFPVWHREAKEPQQSYCSWIHFKSFLGVLTCLELPASKFVLYCLRKPVYSEKTAQRHCCKNAGGNNCRMALISFCLLCLVYMLLSLLPEDIAPKHVLGFNTSYVSGLNLRGSWVNGHIHPSPLLHSPPPFFRIGFYPYPLKLLLFRIVRCALVLYEQKDALPPQRKNANALE